MTSITAVLPAFNAGSFITAALDSVRAQTRKPDEIIVVDDASTDDTVAVTQAWLATSDIPGRVIRLGRNGGAAGARNAGITAAQSELVAMLDSDDLWLPNMAELLERALASQPDTILAFGLREYLEADRRMGEYQGANRLAATFGPLGSGLHRSMNSQQAYLLNVESAVTSCSAAIVKRQAAIDCGLFDPAFRTSQDREFVLRLSRQGGFVFVDEPVSLYRLHDSNTTHTRNAVRNALNRLAVLDKMYSERERLQLTAAELTATLSALEHTAHGALYAASARGLASYVAACRALSESHARQAIWDPRSLLRACWRTVFSIEN